MAILSSPTSPPPLNSFSFFVNHEILDWILHKKSLHVTDRPYAEFIAGMKAAHKRLLQVHLGAEPPTARRALVK
jgi:hypothetical protein